jgi:hypothetical protein
VIARKNDDQNVSAYWNVPATNTGRTNRLPEKGQAPNHKKDGFSPMKTERKRKETSTAKFGLIGACNAAQQRPLNSLGIQAESYLGDFSTYPTLTVLSRKCGKWLSNFVSVEKHLCHILYFRDNTVVQS